MRIHTAIGGTAFLIIIGVLGWPFYGSWLEERLNRRPFNSEAWKDDKQFRDDVRLRMVDDLLRGHDFSGMSRAGVIALLGKPDEAGCFPDWHLVYWLGPERGFIRMDSEWLVFRLDPQEKVSEFRIMTD